jgi:Transposase DDE domain
MDSVTADFNNLNSRFLKRPRVSRQSISARAESLPESFFKDVCFDISSLIDKFYYSRNKYSYDVLAVDGSDTNLRKANEEAGFDLNNSGQSITALNLGIYNVTRNYPVDISLVKHSDERKAFLEFIRDKQKSVDITNSIFVFDRGFDGKEFLKKLENLGLKYVCRIRSNDKLTESEFDDSIQNLDENITTRIVKYVVKEMPYYLATNLYDQTEFSIVKLEQIYFQRWTIEEAFKYIQERKFQFGISEPRN